LEILILQIASKNKYETTGVLLPVITEHQSTKLKCKRERFEILEEER